MPSAPLPEALNPEADCSCAQSPETHPRSWQACPFEHGEASCPNCEALELVVIRVLAGLKNPCSREP